MGLNNASQTGWQGTVTTHITLGWQIVCYCADGVSLFLWKYSFKSFFHIEGLKGAPWHFTFCLVFSQFSSNSLRKRMFGKFSLSLNCNKQALQTVSCLIFQQTPSILWFFGRLKDISGVIFLISRLWQKPEISKCQGVFLKQTKYILCFIVSRGIFNQGYLCMKCGLGAHKECLGRLGICGRTGEMGGVLPNWFVFHFLNNLFSKK